MPEPFPKTTQKNQPSQRNPLWYDVLYPSYHHRNKPLRATNQPTKPRPQWWKPTNYSPGKEPRRGQQNSTTTERTPTVITIENRTPGMTLPTEEVTPRTHPPKYLRHIRHPRNNRQRTASPGRVGADWRSNLLNFPPCKPTYYQRRKGQDGTLQPKREVVDTLWMEFFDL